MSVSCAGEATAPRVPQRPATSPKPAVIAQPHAEAAVEARLSSAFTASEVPGTQFGLDTRLTEYRHGKLRLWITPAIPAATQREVARRIRSTVPNVSVIELPSDEPSERFLEHLAERIADVGFPLADLSLDATTALAQRSRELTTQSDSMVEALREATMEDTSARAAFVQAAKNQRPAAVKAELGRIATFQAPALPDAEALRAQDAAALDVENRERATFNLAPITQASLAIFELPDPVVLRLVMEAKDDARPSVEHAAAVLSAWRKRYGARLTSSRLDVEVATPPRTLAEARRAAIELYLMCPAHPDGFSTHRFTGDELIEQVKSRRWACNWFVE